MTCRTVPLFTSPRSRGVRLYVVNGFTDADSLDLGPERRWAALYAGSHTRHALPSHRSHGLGACNRLHACQIHRCGWLSCSEQSCACCARLLSGSRLCALRDIVSEAPRTLRREVLLRCDVDISTKIATATLLNVLTVNSTPPYLVDYSSKSKRLQFKCLCRSSLPATFGSQLLP